MIVGPVFGRMPKEGVSDCWNWGVHWEKCLLLKLAWETSLVVENLLHGLQLILKLAICQVFSIGRHWNKMVMGVHLKNGEFVSFHLVEELFFPSYWSLQESLF